MRHMQFMLYVQHCQDSLTTATKGHSQNKQQPTKQTEIHTKQKKIQQTTAKNSTKATNAKNKKQINATVFTHRQSLLPVALFRNMLVYIFEPIIFSFIQCAVTHHCTNGTHGTHGTRSDPH